MAASKKGSKNETGGCFKMIKDYLMLIWKNVTHKKIRSWLTVIGVVIGIAAIISLIALGQGLESGIEEQFSKMGISSLRVIPKGLMGQPERSDILTTKDSDICENVIGVDYVTPMLVKSIKVSYSNEDKFVSVYSYPSDQGEKGLADLDVKYAKGRAFKDGEKEVAIIGSKFSEDTFRKEIRIGNKIDIGNDSFKVIGIFEETGTNVDNVAYIPLEQARETFSEPDGLSVIVVHALEGVDLEELGKKVIKDLKRSRDDELFEVYTPKQLLEQVSSILGIVQIILVGIASISLVVGGVGIMNSMFTSVLERTTEIGTMKAIGATNKDILLLFLIESGSIGLVGGTFGVILGSVMAYSVEFVASQLGFGLISISVSPILILFALAFSFLVGVASGVIPAIRASKLIPVEALRYE
ncbi:MAG: ABC transporter permease [Candidatus Nanoarchaeia archaeon]|nr:ABC transporter permease [Candidatus Nanoarchaeia archaeon]